MDTQVTFIGTFRIPDSRAWHTAIARMTEYVRANVPRIRSFHAFAAADGASGTVVYTHPDADSLDQHLSAAATLITEGTAMVEVSEIVLLGSPHTATVELLRAGGTPVTVHEHVAGFDSPSAA
jgi:hypothetical protein